MSAEFVSLSSYRSRKSTFVVSFSTVAVMLFGAAFTVPAARAASPEVTRSHRLGIVTFVRGQNGQPIDLAPIAGGNQPAAAAVTLTQGERFFAQYGSIFGMVDPRAELVESRSETDGIGWTHTTYEQYFREIPVFSGLLKVHQDAAGRLMSVNGRFYPISPKMETTPSVSASEAEQRALSAVDANQAYVESNKLVIVDPGWYGDPAVGARLAYHIVVADPAVMVREAFFIDARCGEILDQWSMICETLNREVHDAAGSSSLPGPVARIEGEPPVGAPPNEVDRTYDYIGDTHYFYMQAFGRDSFDNGGSTMIATVNSTAANCPNAFWNGYQTVYCAGIARDDVIAHEFTHAVTQYSANLIYQNQPGQLNESFSDVFGETVDLYNGDAAFAGAPGGTPWPTHPTGPGIDTPNNLRTDICSNRGDGFLDGVRWLIGEDTDGFSDAIRDMWDPTCHNHPDTANSPFQTCSATDSGGVHSGSGVPNHAYAIITDGTTFNGYTVTGIGPIKSAAVWYRALTVYLTQVSDFADAYQGFRQAALDLIGTDPNDPRTGLPSGNPITAEDAFEVEEALLAVEMNTDGLCGAVDPVLNQAPAVECGEFTTLFSDDFESGVNGWTVSNSGPPIPYDWEQVSGLPNDRTGTAWFCADPYFGDCGGDDESSVHSLFSPVIALPGGATAPFASFTHFLRSESGWDAGNLKYRVNGGAWTLVPRSAFAYNAYNGRAHGPEHFSTNPLAGQDAWTGAGNEWGRTVIDLRSLAAGGDTIQFQFEFGKDGCTGALGWYVDDFRVYQCGDCDNVTGPDIDAVQFRRTAPLMGNIGSGSPQSFTLTAPPDAAGTVALQFNARGDFSSLTEYVDVTVNGQNVGQVFVSNAGDCPDAPEFQEITIPAATWNAAVAGGDALVTMTASPDVNPTVSICGNISYITFSVRYLPVTGADCNANGQIDSCELTLDSVQAFVDTLLGDAPYSCLFDLDPNSQIDGNDIQPVVEEILGS